MMYTKGTNTIYINNLNEKVKIDELKRSLHAVFSQFGEIVDIAASKTLKMRGQAFVAFKKDKDAVSAANSMQGFPFFDKPLKIQLAKCDSDCVAKLLGTYIKREKRVFDDKKEKKVKRAPHQVVDNSSPVSNAAIISDYDLTHTPSTVHSGSGAQTLTSIVLPPAPPTPAETARNKILFLENLPHDTNQMMLIALFGKFPGFKEIRSVAGRPEIAFAEFLNEWYAESAQTALQGFKFDPNHLGIKISFAKK